MALLGFFAIPRSPKRDSIAVTRRETAANASAGSSGCLPEGFSEGTGGEAGCGTSGAFSSGAEPLGSDLEGSSLTVRTLAPSLTALQETASRSRRGEARDGECLWHTQELSERITLSRLVRWQASDARPLPAVVA